MSVLQGGVSAQAGGTTTITPTMVTGYAVGDKLLCLVDWHNSTGVAPSCSDGSWTFLGSTWGSIGGYGLDAGPRGVAAWEKVATSTSETSPTFTQAAGSGGAGFGAYVAYYTKTLPSWAASAYAGGEDTTSGTGFSATASSDPGGTTGDLLVLLSAMSDDTASFSAGPTLTWTGATVSFTNSTATANGQGNDMRVVLARASVTAGNSSAAPVHAGTLAVAATGTTAFIRLRDQPEARTGTLAATAVLSATAVQVGIRAGTLAGTAAFSAAAFPVYVRTGTLAATAALSATAVSGGITGTLAATAALTATGRPATTGALSASGALTATAREVEIAAGTLAGTAALTAAVREVEVAAGTLAAGAAFTATARPVAIVAGALSATALLTALASVAAKPGPIILVEIGAWSQEWELGQDLDAGDVTMINAEGAVLDGLTAQWSSDRLMAQPTPTEVSFSIYVPEGAVGPSLDEGTLSHIRIVPPSYTDNPDYLPLLDTYGSVTYGAAKPVAKGLSYAVIHTDHLAGLGESMVGNVKWKGGDWPDILTAGEPGQTMYDRLQRLKHAMDLDGQKLQWSPFNALTRTGADFLVSDALELFMLPNNLKSLPDRPADPAATNEVAEQTLREFTVWGPDKDTGSAAYHVKWRIDGHVDFHDTVQAQTPAFRAWSDTYARPVMFATEDVGRFRLAWVSPRVEGNAGLPLTLELTDKLRLTAVPLDGTTIPDSSKYGAWVPGCAVPKDDVEWTVDKDAHPRQAHGTGWFHAVVGGDINISTDWISGYVGTPTHPAAELQIELPELTSDTEFTPITNTQPEPLLWSLVGYWYDTLPQYELTTVPIRYDAITDPDQWPRLFQQPDQDSRYPSQDWWAGAQGRFIFVYDIADRWHPYGMDHWWGFLKGATLTVEAGKITATADLAHREAGPCGPRGTPTAGDGWSDNWKLLVGDAPAAVTWNQWNADTDLAPLLPADIDPSVRWASLYLTSL